MNNQRLINMLIRMGMRFGMKWLNQRDGQSTKSNKKKSNANAQTPAINTRALSKSMRTLKKLTRF